MVPVIWKTSVGRLSREDCFIKLKPNCTCVCAFFRQSPKRVGAMWAEAGLSWSDFLPDNVDINKFVTEQVCGVLSCYCYAVNVNYWGKITLRWRAVVSFWSLLVIFFIICERDCEQLFFTVSPCMKITSWEKVNLNNIKHTIFAKTAMKKVKQRKSSRSSLLKMILTNGWGLRRGSLMLPLCRTESGIHTGIWDGLEWL